MSDYLSEEVKRQQKLQARREQHDREEQAAREQRETDARQEELAGYLKRRGEDFKRTTGKTEVPREALEGWELDFVNGKEAEREEEKRRRWADFNDTVF